MHVLYPVRQRDCRAYLAAFAKAPTAGSKEQLTEMSNRFEGAKSRQKSRLKYSQCKRGRSHYYSDNSGRCHLCNDALCSQGVNIAHEFVAVATIIARMVAAAIVATMVTILVTLVTIIVTMVVTNS